MKSNFLFPHSYMIAGWIITVPSVVFGILMMFSTGNINGWLGGFFTTLVGVALAIGLLMVAFSKEKEEDEYLAMVRSNCLRLALWIYYIILIAGTLCIYGFLYASFSFICLYIPLIVYIIVFRYYINKIKSAVKNEE